jgi:hypothetical protein
VVEDRRIPRFDSARFGAAIRAAGFSAQQLPGSDVGGFQILVMKVMKAPCAGSVHYYDVPASGVDAFVRQLEPQTANGYVLARDAERVLLIAVDAVPSGPNAECMEKLLLSMTSSKR